MHESRHLKASLTAVDVLADGALIRSNDNWKESQQAEIEPPAIVRSRRRR